MGWDKIFLQLPKWVKYIFYSLGSIVFFIAIIYILMGKPVKMLTFEFNQEVKHDTLKIPVKIMDTLYYPNNYNKDAALKNIGKIVWRVYNLH